ncbi:MAG: CBS domain-containing protein [Candidatus Aenigmarchaeota archaeon]|nr:CBS domain-containing protein [Candidatus Aenigmarchaeota archaeon]
MEISDVSKIIRKDFPKVGPDVSISEIINHLKNHEAIPVFQGDEFIGIVSLSDIIRRDYPPNTKTKTIVRKNLPEVNENDSITKVARLFLESDSDALPVFSGKTLLGLVYQRDVIRASKHIINSSMKDIINVPEVIEKNETIGKARGKIKEYSISRLPVVDENGKLVGIVDSVDFLKVIIPKRIPGKQDLTGDVIPDYKLPVTTIMDTNPIVVSNKIGLKEAIDVMEKYGKSYIIVTKNNEPIGIITPKDILEIIASTEKERGVYVQIAGLDNIDNFFDRDKIDKMIGDTVKKLGKMFDRIDYMFVHIKQYKKGGDKLYSIRTRIMTSDGLFISKSSSWNAIAAVDEALDRLEKQVVREKKKKSDLQKPRGV